LLLLQPGSGHSLNIERVTAITDEKAISGEVMGARYSPHKTKAINTRAEVGRAERPDPD
jgi:hypothetical protein